MIDSDSAGVRMTRRFGSGMWIAWTLASFVFVAAGMARAAAQQTGTSTLTGPAARADGGAAVQQSGHGNSAGRPSRTSRKSDAPRVRTKPWSIEDALPANSSAVRSSGESPSQIPLGRVPLRSGSIGIETEAKVKSDEFADGRKVPGLENVTRDPPSYIGLSVSVPTSNKSMLPVPILPPFGRPE